MTGRRVLRTPSLSKRECPKYTGRLEGSSRGSWFHTCAMMTLYEPWGVLGCTEESSEHPGSTAGRKIKIRQIRSNAGRIQDADVDP